MCTAPWCRCVTPSPCTFLFIYRRLVTFFVLSCSESTRRETPHSAARALYDPFTGPNCPRIQQLLPQLRFDCFTRRLSSLLTSPTRPLALSYAAASNALPETPLRSTPFNNSLTTRPQSHATGKCDFLNHIRETFLYTYTQCTRANRFAFLSQFRIYSSRLRSTTQIEMGEDHS